MDPVTKFLGQNRAGEYLTTVDFLDRVFVLIEFDFQKCTGNTYRVPDSAKCARSDIYFSPCQLQKIVPYLIDRPSIMVPCRTATMTMGSQ